MRKPILVLLLVLLTGCSHNQSKSLGMNTSYVNVYPQYMSDLELCDTLYFGRPSNQTLVAIGSEFNRRKLSKSWCYRYANQWYFTRFLHASRIW
ncbi:hypothetical protein [Vibrio gallicus]|uniref:hypothetical protein n=1 Tax=Vibrio gallicus TaxID=190897 RepID=UPI0021C3A259|nr:hypothetical protein [Vibrio gallicus]